MINVFDNMSLIYLIYYNEIVISVCNDFFANLLENIELFDLIIHILFLFHVS